MSLIFENIGAKEVTIIIILITTTTPYWMTLFSLNISTRISTVHPGTIWQLVRVSYDTGKHFLINSKQI